MERRPRGPRPVHPLVGERVEPELQVLVGRLLRPVAPLVDRARLVVDDARALGRAIDAIPAADDAIAPEHEREALLHQVRWRAPLLLLVEAPQGGQSRGEPLVLVLRADEALGEPRRLERRLELLDAGRRALAPAPQVIADRLVEREPVD